MSAQLSSFFAVRQRSRSPAAGTRQGGAASLIVVMILFFVMALVAAYTNRNLIFEARTSINQYRSTQAVETAEAGLEWAVAQLNGGRILGNCTEPGIPSPNLSFRQRYLGIDPSSGMITALTQAAGAPPPPRRAGCIWNGAGWTCDCPINGDPVLPAQAANGIHPAFWVSFSTASVSLPGVVQIIVNGCTSLDPACLGADDTTINAEGLARLSTLVALKSSLTTPPAAALTVFGQVVGGGALSAYNTEGDRGGITIQAGGAVNSATFTLGTIPGTPTPSVIAGDPSLSGIAGVPAAPPRQPLPIPAADRVFASTFGAWPAAFRLQPGAVIFNCPAGGCRQALADTVAMNPDRVIWIDGDLTIESAGDVGSPPDPADLTVAGPATIVATGNLIFTAPGRIYGFVYTRSGNWTGSGEVQGAAFSEANLAATAAPTVVFNGAVIDSLRLRAGSFVRVPGSWRDFRQ